MLAPDHPWLLSIIAGACAMAGANIVDAQIYTTTDGRALDTISLSREFDRDEDEERRANRIADSIEKALRGELRLPDVVAKRAPPKGRIQRVRAGARRSPSTTSGRTATRWWRSPASTAPACCTS